ncbi:hypothetical protein EDD28_3344 [Salana multivorans]|uniref:Uncharacterized protein n=1 Tax=Salana multivorans TaxID=120377 RepID=A0A3N2D2B4_9MICO|nr:hypothetical protein [Salana multivorans]ROR93915.1 hypothetical protein EDD28_3344 [Salana multivorans]
MIGIFGLVVVLFLVLVVAGAIVAVVLAITTAQRRGRERTASLGAYARGRGWRYEAYRSGLAHRVGLEGTPNATNVVEGTADGRAFVAFDHTRYVSDGQNGHRAVPVSVVVVHLGVVVPELEISRQGALDRFFQGIFGTDHLVGDTVFDDAVRIRTNSPEFTAEILTLPMKRLLLARLHRSWRFVGDSLVTVADGQHTPQQLEEALGSCLQVIATIPPQVWARLQGGGAAAVPRDVVRDAVADPVRDAPALPGSEMPGGLFEESVGWQIDPITGQRRTR